MDQNKKGKIYIVATPIGNLEDITFRAINTLKDVDLIAAEDTRHTLKLLNHYSISKPLISYHRHNEEFKVNKLIEEIISGKNIAIVSDAGTPGISDPGEVIVKEGIKNNIEIVPIPGACAMVNALVCSGLSTDEFLFIGFLPLNKKTRNIKLDEIKNEKKTIILYEAPHKLKNTLNDLVKVLDSREIVLARELTKIHEEFIRGTASDLLDKCELLKGEFVIIIEGNKNIIEESFFENMTLEDHFEFYNKEGFDKKEIIKKIAKDRNVNKNEIYKQFI